MTFNSHCKVNLLLNILGKRPDGFHELETLMHPVAICDTLSFEKCANGITLQCTEPSLPVDEGNIVFRAAAMFMTAAKVTEGVRIVLDKKLPLAAGLGGGSGNAACTLGALNQLFGFPLEAVALHKLAAGLGSDVPFFLQDAPALAFGRGEAIEPVGPLKALEQAAFLIVHPGFGVSTPWAYQALGRFSEALNGRPGRARQLVSLLQTGSLEEAGAALYNSMEAPVLEKYPLLGMFQDFMRENGALSLMSGSGSSTFAITETVRSAQELGEKFKERFGPTHWVAVAPCAVRPGLQAA